MSSGDMYKKAGLSSLERLIGRDVASICFVRDYVQIGFDGLVFTCYTLPSVRSASKSIGATEPGCRDALVGLIGKHVQSVSEAHREELSIFFEEGQSLSISLRFEDAACVEAAMLHELGGPIFDVWRYE